MLLNGVTGEAQKFKDNHLDFVDTHTLVEMKELYAFKYGGPVSVYIIADFNSKENLVTTL